MKTALELLQALQARWPAHPPRRHALLIAEDGRLSIQLGLEQFYWAKLDPEDLNKPVAQIIEEAAPLLDQSRANVAAMAAAMRGRKKRRP